MDVSIVIPTLNGGARLAEVLDAIDAQSTERSFEVVCVDSSSDDPTTLRVFEQHAVRVERIERKNFDHGATRDLGASETTGQALVFLNQDAVPIGDRWLDVLTEPLLAPSGPEAVQGGIREPLEGDDRFYWLSSGPRFYFTREHRRWLDDHGGIGFSTVNAGMRRDVWQELPFGECAYMEDKLWQHRAAQRGYRIERRTEAAVLHSHDYDVRALAKRCWNEGVGWGLAGVTYSGADALADLVHLPRWRETVAGIVRGRFRQPSEALFPLLRPLAVYLGNRSKILR